MKELTKSLASCTWAMSVFGVQQMTNLFMPRDGGMDKTTGCFDRVAAAAEEQLGPTMRSAFRAGNELQRMMVDLMFGGLMMGSGCMNPAAGQTPPGSNTKSAWSWGPPRSPGGAPPQRESPAPRPTTQ